MAEELSDCARWGPTLAALAEDFDALDEWEERYRRLIDFGRALPRLAAEERVDANRVAGCASRVWLVAEIRPAPDGGRALTLRGESDALIVQGLIAVLLAACSGRAPEAILACDFDGLFRRLGLGARLTPQRVNGLAAMKARVLAYARAAVDGAA